MAVIRVQKNKNYTVMANYHLHDETLSLKAKGLLSYMLSLPEDWDYSVKGLCATCKEGIKAIRAILREMEQTGYLVRTQFKDEKGCFDYRYDIYEKPQPHTQQPCTQNGYAVNGYTRDGYAQKDTQLNTNIQSTKEQSTYSNKKINKESTETKKFVKPTIAEIGSYIKEKGLSVDPEHFFNYYESNGWKVGRNPMKNWKAALQTWQSRNKATPAPTRKALATVDELDLDQPYEPGPSEDIRPWRDFFDEWEETIGMRPAQTIGNVQAAKRLMNENNPETIQALLVALAMRGKTRYITREIKNITTPQDLLRERQRVWAFYQENRDSWRRQYEWSQQLGYNL